MMPYKGGIRDDVSEVTPDVRGARQGAPAITACFNMRGRGKERTLMLDAHDTGHDKVF